MGNARGRRTELAERVEVLNLTEEAQTNGCRQSVACLDIGVSAKTLKRWREGFEDQRQGPNTTPANKLSEEEREEVVKIAISKEFVDLPPCQIVPKLADLGRYVASESTFYRILKSLSLLAHRGKSKRPEKKRPAPLVAKGPNQIYSWDITYLKSLIRGEFFYLYMFIDIFSRKIVGWKVHGEESMILSSQLIDVICKSEGVEKGQLTLHADNGGPMKGATMLATLQSLGVVPSFSRPRVSDDNPFSESLFKTVKYCPQYPSKPFESIESAKDWVKDFVHWYNTEHLHSGIKFVSPIDRHNGKDIEILSKRKDVYEKAKSNNPNRWSGETRNWDSVKEVHLNHLQKNREVANNIAS